MAKKTSLSDIIAAYRQLVAEGNSHPTSDQVAERAHCTEKEFGEFFGSVEEVGRKAWSDYLSQIQRKTEASETYRQYGAREKMIAYFFSLFEGLEPDRSFVRATHCREGLQSDYRRGFKSHMRGLVEEGLAQGDLKDRLSLSQYYPDLLWGLHQQLVRFWLDDTSEEYAATERAIEVFGKVPLELMGHNLLDSVADSLRFALENVRLDRFFR